MDLLLQERSTGRKAILALLNIDVMNFGQNISSKLVWQPLILILSNSYERKSRAEHDLSRKLSDQQSDVLPWSNKAVHIVLFP